MSFKNEMREFMQEMRLAFVKEQTVIQEQSKLILFLERQNKELSDRLMARDYPELKTYGDVKYKKDPVYDFEEDEENAGAILDPDNLNEV